MRKLKVCRCKRFQKYFVSDCCYKWFMKNPLWRRVCIIATGKLSLATKTCSAHKLKLRAMTEVEKGSADLPISRLH